jgi:hypothetical protein
MFLQPTYRQAAYSQKAIDILDEIYKKEKSDSILIEKAGCLYENNQKEESKELLDSIQDENLSEYDEAKKASYYAAHHLRNGRFKEGMKGIVFETDKMRNIEHGRPVFHTRQELPLEFWNGIKECKNLIVFAEAGLGDEIINIRFMNHLKERGINAKWYGHWHQNVANKRTGAAEWFRQNGFDVITEFDAKKYKDYMWTYSQYVPVLLDIEEKDLWNGPYMTAGKKDLKGTRKKVGLRWAGNKYPMHRNVNLKDIYESIKDLDVDFYSLQKDELYEQVKEYPEIIDLSEDLNSVVDLADYVNSMDYVITCSTCVCPIAGAIDKDNITLVPLADYYVFNTKDNYTPWYSNKMRLVRQKTSRVWTDVMGEVREVVKEKLDL